MANSLTGINHAYLTKQQTSINQIKAKFTNNKDKNVSFSRMLKDKINQDGTINQNKLTKKEKKLHNTCVEMESLLWKLVLNSMKKTINKYKLIDGGQSEEIFTDFLYDEYAMMLAKNSNTNLAGNIYKQLSGYL